MSLVQTKIEFPIRKKRSTFNLKKSVSENEKENTQKLNGSNSTRVCTEYLTDVSSMKQTNVRKKAFYSSDSDSSDTENGASPPKRDRLSDKDSRCSPSQILKGLHIGSPVLQSSSNENKNLKPKKLFGKELVYQQARRALHSSAPSQMPGREEELQQLHEFLKDSLSQQRSSTLYISGPPGTGKTACLSKVLQEQDFQVYKSVYVNCTSMKSSSSIYSRICEELKLRVVGKNESSYKACIEKYFTTSTKMNLLVLDEIDQLDSRRQAILYTIFEWPFKHNSKLVLIGIANALDLTDRILPRLQARLELKPKLMHFPPYTKQQIVHIILHRLKELEVNEVFSPVALQLLAGKVAAVSGDIRRALDIARRVLELAESQKASPAFPLHPTTDHASNTSSPKKASSSQSVDLKVVIDVLNSVYGTSQTLGHNDDNCKVEDNFPLQQKILVCTLLLIVKKGSTKEVSVGKLHDVYRRVCSKRNLSSVDQAEFTSLCQLVETRGIIHVQMRKEARFAKVSLQWDEEEVASALKDRQLLSTILNDTASLTR